jgi:hypothetical protein
LEVLRGLPVSLSSCVGAQRGSEDGDSTSEARLERGENVLTMMGDDGDGERSSDSAFLIGCRGGREMESCFSKK